MITFVYDKCKTGSSEEQKEKTWKEIENKWICHGDQKQFVIIAIKCAGTH